MRSMSEVRGVRLVSRCVSGIPERRCGAKVVFMMVLFPNGGRWMPEPDEPGGRDPWVPAGDAVPQHGGGRMQGVRRRPIGGGARNHARSGQSPPLRRSGGGVSADALEAPKEPVPRANARETAAIWGGDGAVC